MGGHQRAEPSLGPVSGVLALTVIFCSGPISHPYPQLGKTAGRNPGLRAEKGRQHSAAWVASTTQGPGPRDWQSTLQVGVCNLCVCAGSVKT